MQAVSLRAGALLAGWCRGEREAQGGKGRVVLVPGRGLEREAHGDTTTAVMLWPVVALNAGRINAAISGDLPMFLPGNRVR